MHVTPVLRHLNLPTLEGASLSGQAPEALNGIWVGAFSLAALPEIGIWQRLLRSANVPFQVVYVGRISVKDVQSATPASQWDRVLVAPGHLPAWQSVVPVDQPGRAFAWIQLDGIAELLMVGPPTEDAWETFERAALAFANGPGEQDRTPAA
jgi:hypothetical protein